MFLATATAIKHAKLMLFGEVFHSKFYEGAPRSVSYTVAYQHKIPGRAETVKHYATVQYFLQVRGADPEREEVTYVWAYAKCHRPLPSPAFLFEYPVVTESGACGFIKAGSISYKVIFINPRRRLTVGNHSALFVAQDFVK